jgi:hypothetical protein
VTREKTDDGAFDEALSEEAGGDTITTVAKGLAPAPLPPGLLARVLETTRSEPRFERFVDPIARLLDVTFEQARQLLARVSDTDGWEPGFLPGIELFHVRGGPRVANAITGFVRVRENVRFPEHEHFGEESVLIMQGRCEERGKIYGPGDEVMMGANSEHAFTVCPGPDLLYLAVVQKGLRIGDMVLNADDPRV